MGVALAAVLWGTAGCVAQVTKTTGSPSLGAAARMLIGGALLLALAGPAALATMSRLPVRAFAIAAGAMAVFQWALFFALGQGSAIAVTIISVAAAPLASQLATVLRELAGTRVVASSGHVAIRAAAPCAIVVVRRTGLSLAALATMGAIALAAGGTGMPAASLAAGIGSGVAYAVYAAAAARMDRHTPRGSLASTGAALLAGGLLLAPFAASSAAALADPSTLGAHVYLGVAATALPYRLFLSGLRHLGHRTALGILALEPPVATAATQLLLHVAISPAILAALLALAAAMPLQLFLNQQERTTP